MSSPNEAPCGSVRIAKRPPGKSIGETSSRAPACVAVLNDLSTSAHEPVARHLRRNHGLHLLAARDAFAAELELGIWRLPRAHVIGLRGPAKYLLVERNRLVDAARAELRPAERVRFSDGEAARHGLRLPRGDDGAGRILEGAHATLVAHVEGWRHHLSTRGLHLLGEAIDVVSADVDRPRRRRVRRHLRSDTGDLLIRNLGHAVAAILRIRIHLDLPAKHRRIELP